MSPSKLFFSLLIILVAGCSDNKIDSKISKGHFDAAGYECDKSSDKKLCKNELFKSFIKEGHQYVTFDDLNDSQKNKVLFDCITSKQYGLVKYNNCLADRKELALSGKITKVKRDAIPKSNIERLYKSFFYIEVYDKNGESLGSGSGVAVTKNIIASNCHVVGGKNTKHIKIFSVTSDRKQSANDLTEAKLIKSNWDADICLVQIYEKLNLVPVKLRQYKDLNLGDYVRAVGNPIGIIGHTATGEINKLQIASLFKKKGKSVKIIFHDVTIGSGSSGGPLFNLKNELIGINTQGLTSAKEKGVIVGGAINLAVSSDYISELLD